MDGVGDVMNLLFLSLSTGLAGTLFGTLAGLLLPALPPLLMACLLHLTGGLMLAIVCFELLPEAILISQSMAITGVVAGVLLMLLLRLKEESGAAGQMLCLGVALHNLPEGLAVGAGFLDAPALGMALAACIIAHDFPEGLAMSLSLKRARTSPTKIFQMALLSGLPGVMGVWAGYALGGIGDQILSFCLALAAGAMLQIICQHLLPNARQANMPAWVTGCLSLGVLGGALMTHWL